MSKGISYNVYAFIGINGTGKSTNEKRFIISWKQQNPYGLVYAFDPQENFKGLVDIYIEDEDFFEDYDPRLITNSLIVLDDYKELLEKDSVMPKWLKKLIFHRVKNKNQIIYSAHTTDDVLLRLRGYTNNYFMFYSDQKPEDIKKRIPNANEIIEANERIYNEVKKNGRGKYPIFPYVFVDKEKSIIQNVNFK